MQFKDRTNIFHVEIYIIINIERMQILWNILFLRYAKYMVVNIFKEFLILECTKMYVLC